MSPRIGMLIVLATFAVWSSFCGWIGYSLSDREHESEIAKAQAEAQSTRVEVIEQARETDHANAQHAASVEGQRIEASRESEVTFKTIEKKVIDYVHANPDPIGCDLADDGLHAWRAANSGEFPATDGPGDSAGSAGALPGSDPATSKRRP